MSRGIGRIERAIIETFARREKVSDLVRLAHAAYVNPYFWTNPDWRPTRAQLVAVRRALKRLQDTGYPVEPIRINLPGRPMIVLWKGNNRYWWRNGADTNPAQANCSQRLLTRPRAFQRMSTTVLRESSEAHGRHTHSA
jgi:hypothetical protein